LRADNVCLPFRSLPAEGTCWGISWNRGSPPWYFIVADAAGLFHWEKARTTNTFDLFGPEARRPAPRSGPVEQVLGNRQPKAT
jgi:hypothetical protein